MRHDSRNNQVAAAKKLCRATHAWRGDWAVQIGGGAVAWCHARHYGNLVTIDKAQSGGSVQARGAALPLAETSVDLILLIHQLGGSNDAEEILAQAARVLRGEGRLVIVERRLPASATEWGTALRGGMMGCMRLRRLVAGLGLEWRGGRDFTRARLQGRACLSLGASSYAAVAVKRVPCPRLLRPSWKAAHSRRQAVLEEHGHAG